MSASIQSEKEEAMAAIKEAVHTWENICENEWLLLQGVGVLSEKYKYPQIMDYRLEQMLDETVDDPFAYSFYQYLMNKTVNKTWQKFTNLSEMAEREVKLGYFISELHSRVNHETANGGF